MPEYLLFIDTETSGLPANWQAPYSDQDNWPYSVQLAWVIYSQGGELIKEESHYIKDQDFDISPAAFAVHGISRGYLLQHGGYRRDIMGLLAADLDRYQPLVVAHFMQLDYHMVGADFYRSGRGNALEKLPLFCTMLASARYVSNPRSKYLRLNRLHYTLFNREMVRQHEALADARATAACFFEMRRLGDIDDALITQQQPLRKPDTGGRRGGGCLPVLCAGVITSLLLLLWP